MANPGTALPPELETGPLAVPMSMGNQFGGLVAGNPFDVTGAQQAQDAAQAAALRSVLPPSQPMPIQPGQPPAPFQMPPPVAAPAPLEPPQFPSQDPNAYPPQAQPTIPVQPAAQSPANTTAPNRASATPGHGAGPGMVQQFDKQIAQSEADQKQALVDLADVQKEAAFKEGGAYHDKAVQAEIAALEHADKAADVAKRQAALDAIDAANLKRAQDYTIPNFWDNNTGKLVGSTIAVALSGIGAGLLGSTQNQALSAIQHNIDQYMHQQKEKVDNLYRYAEEQGKLNANTKMQYARELLDLKDQHSYILQAAADRVQAVAAEARGSVDDAKANVLASSLGQQAIKDRQDVRELRSKMQLQEAQAEAARGSAAESRARAAQGGYLTPAQANAQAVQVVRQLDQQFRHVSDPKAGLAAHERELGGKLKAIQNDPNNAANWVALVDSAIKTNTGKAAIMSQYQLYMGHTAGQNDSAEQLLDKFRTGLPSPKQRAAILGAAQAAYNEVTTQAGEANRLYHESVDTNPIVQQNPAAKAMIAMHERNTFGGFPNYGKQETVLAPGQQPPATAAVPTANRPGAMTLNGRTYTLQPDGTYK